MLVKVLGFGTNWWTRVGRDIGDPDRFTRHAAFYNSTGICCGRTIRRHWITPGLIRINGVIGFDPKQSERALGETFVCSDLAYALGGNRLLLKSKSAKSAVPDSFLVVVSSRIHGNMNFASGEWRSILSCLIAASQLRDCQEAMLLMKAGDWVQTSAGFWQLQVFGNRRDQATLVRIGDAIAK